MTALFASIFALALGPLIYQTFGPMRRTDRIVSGFILVVIASTLLVEVIPEAYDEIGYLSIILALIGFSGPTLIEKLFTRAANQTHSITILLGITGLIFHACLDGAALQTEGTGHQHENLSLAIILHRLPVGLTIWWLLKPLIGEKFALLTLFTMAVATIGGFYLSVPLYQTISGSSFIMLQAFISGSLMHVILHKPHADGCMHTSQTHEHSHVHQHQTNNSGGIIAYLASKAPDRWELVGMISGLTLALTLHTYLE